MTIGKGDKRRPRFISREEEVLRWKLAFGAIGFDEFEKRYRGLRKRGLIYHK